MYNAHVINKHPKMLSLGRKYNHGMIASSKGEFLAVFEIN